MKKLKFIIPVLVLALILSFTPACNKDESTNETELTDKALAEEVSETVEEETVEEVAEESETYAEELIGACALGNLEDVKRLLEQNADVNAKDNDGLTALMYTVLGDHTETAEILIDNGADVNAKDNNGWTALMYAAFYGYTETAEILIDNGADVNAKNNDGLTVLMIAEGNDQTEIVNLLREVEEEAEEEVAEEQEAEEEEEETDEKVLSAPTIRLEIIEGPTLVEESICYYRVKAIVTGDPYPAISFNKDDSSGSLGKNIAQVNLYKEGESFTLEATATNSQDTASASITLTDTCERPTAPTGAEIPILIINDLGATLSLSLSGPASYSFSIPAGQQNIYVIPGIYNYTGKCSGAVDSGTKDLSKSASGDWRWWWE